MSKLNDFWFDAKYYLYTVPKDWYYNVKWFFKNLWRFRKQLWKYRTWDYYYSVTLFADSLEWLADDIENGYEEERSATKKVTAIRELVSLLRKTVDDNDYGMMDKYWDSKKNEITLPINVLSDKLRKERKKTLNRIHKIIAGQDSKVFDEIKGKSYDDYVEVFDGTGYEGWWN